MTDLRQAAHNKRVDDVIRVAIAAAWDKLDDKPEQEPTPWRDMVVVSLVREGINKHRARELADHFAAPPQQQAEPVAWGVFENNLHDMFFTQEEAQEMAVLKGTHAQVRPLYTSPPQRPWVALEAEEILDMFDVNNVYGSKWIEFARTVENKLMEKNT